MDGEAQISRKLLLDTSLDAALSGVNVSPRYLKAARALLKEQAELVETDGKREVKIGDKALADAVKEWAGTDEGKHYIEAPGNGGGGSTGGKGGASDPDLSNLSPVERLTIARQQAKT